jgi:hypothetical protein
MPENALRVALIILRSRVQAPPAPPTIGPCQAGFARIERSGTTGASAGDVRKMPAPDRRAAASRLSATASRLSPEQTRIHIERHRRGRVAEHLLNYLDVGPGRNRQAGRSVPEVVGGQPVEAGGNGAGAASWADGSLTGGTGRS